MRVDRVSVSEIPTNGKAGIENEVRVVSHFTEEYFNLIGLEKEQVQPGIVLSMQTGTETSASFYSLSRAKVGRSMRLNHG